MLTLHVEVDAPEGALPLGSAVVWLETGHGPIGAAWRLPGSAEPPFLATERAVYLLMVAGALRGLADELEERAHA